MQTLTLLGYLVRHGSERVVKSARDHMYDMKLLETYQCTDEQGRDQGAIGKCKTLQKGMIAMDSFIQNRFFCWRHLVSVFLNCLQLRAASVKAVGGLLECLTIMVDTIASVVIMGS